MHECGFDPPFGLIESLELTQEPLRNDVTILRRDFQALPEVVALEHSLNTRNSLEPQCVGSLVSPPLYLFVKAPLQAATELRCQRKRKQLTACFTKLVGYFCDFLLEGGPLRLKHRFAGRV